MSFYRQGLALAAPQKQLYAVGALIATPGAIKDETNTLNTEVHQMDSELGAVRASWGTVRDADLPPQQMVMDQWWHATWVPFLQDWDKFWQVHGNHWGLANVYHNFWGSTWEKVQEYRARLITLRASARKVGYNLVGPEPTNPKQGWVTRATCEMWSLAKLVIYLAIAAGLGFAIWKVLA